MRLGLGLFVQQHDIRLLGDWDRRLGFGLFVQQRNIRLLGNQSRRFGLGLLVQRHGIRLLENQDRRHGHGYLTTEAKTDLSFVVHLDNMALKTSKDSLGWVAAGQLGRDLVLQPYKEEFELLFNGHQLVVRFVCPIETAPACLELLLEAASIFGFGNYKCP